MTSCGDGKGTSDILPEVPSKELSLRDAVYELQNSTSFNMWLCAHRGNTEAGIRENIPENSLSAIRKSISIGVDMVELDVRMTSDGVLVLMHDESIDRTTNGRGNISSMTYEALKRYYLKSGDVTSNETIPTLENALTEAKGRIFLNLDIANKDIPAHKIAQMLNKQHMDDQTLLYVSSDKNYAIDLIQANTNLLIHPMIKNSADIEFYVSRFPKECIVMQLSTEDAMEGILSKKIADMGFPVFSNIVGRYDKYALQGNFSGLVSMINKHNQIVQTDYFEIANKYLKSKGYR